jgi:hypothetical protein
MRNLYKINPVIYIKNIITKHCIILSTTEIHIHQLRIVPNGAEYEKKIINMPTHLVACIK